MIKVAIKIQLKKEVLDTPGRAILKLIQKEHPFVQECFYGKYIELSLEGADPKKALRQAEEITKNLLRNELIETYKIEVLE